MAPPKRRNHHSRDEHDGRERRHGRDHRKGRLHRSPSRDSISLPQIPRVFRYDPLDSSVNSIRLLELEPVDKQQTLSCRLVHVPFRNRPKYEALSYTWGSPEPTDTILLNGMPMAIQQNLHEALLALREDHKSRVLWADAICIDQSNLEEKGWQLGFMDVIYKRAATVLIWLGGANQMIQTVFKSGLASLTENEKRTYCSWVCGHSYWTRLWIIQEVTLSRTLRVCIGHHSEKWETFLESLSQHVESYEELQSQIRVIKNLDQKRKGWSDDKSCLEKLLEDFPYAECHNPRDKIYGLLGLAHDCKDGSIKPDYTKPTFDLFTEVLGKFNRTQRAVKSGRSTAFDRSMRVVYFSQLVSSILGSPACPHSDTGKSVLAVAAVAGEILEVGPTYDETLDNTKKMKIWESAYQAHYKYPATQKKMREAIAAYDSFLYDNSHRISTKVFSIDPNRMYSQAEDLSRPASITPRKSHTGNTYRRDSLDAEPVTEITWDSKEAHWLSKDLDNIAGFHRSSKRWFSSRRVASDTSGTKSGAHRSLFDGLFSSSPPRSIVPPPSRHSQKSSSPHLFLGSNELVGSVPSNAKKGDIICQFWKTDVTALLRRQKDTSSFQVVGKVHLSTGSMERLEPKHGAKAMLIEMDLSTLSRLTC